MAEDFAILVLSCDKYADLWVPFLQQFRKYFPVGGRRLYVGSNLVACDCLGVTAVLSGPDTDWSTSYKKILSQIPERKLFVILEDVMLAGPVDETRLRVAADLLERGALHVKYLATPKPDAPSDFPGVGIYKRGAPYRATVCGFWDRSYLTSLLIEGESPWEFEILGSYRASFPERIYGLDRPLCDWMNMVEKGRWIPASLIWAKQEGLPLQLDRRIVLRGSAALLSRMKMLYFEWMIKVPWRWRVGLMNTLRRALISY